jgi:hypothetical protein
MVCCSWYCIGQSAPQPIAVSAVSAAALGCGRCHCRLWHFCEFCLGPWHIASATWAVLYLFWQLHKLLQESSGGLINCFICWHLQLRHAQSVAHGSHAGPAKDRLTGYQQPTEMQSDHIGVGFCTCLLLLHPRWQAYRFVQCTVLAGRAGLGRLSRGACASCCGVCLCVFTMQWVAKTLVNSLEVFDCVVFCKL